MSYGVKCSNCRWTGSIDEVLSAPNPFDPQYDITGCPSRQAVDAMLRLCDEPGCYNEATCGTPVLGGYRHTCGKHQPSEEQKRASRP